MGVSTLMHFAAISLHADVLMIYLSNCGISACGTDERGASPLHWAARNTECKQAIPILLKLGASPLVQDVKGNTPLHYAAECNNTRAAKYLLRADPSLVHTRNSMGQTPLSVACEQENTKMVRFLFASGADFEDSCLVMSVQMNSTRLISILLSQIGYEAWSSERKLSLCRIAREENKTSALRTLLRKFKL